MAEPADTESSANGHAPEVDCRQFTAKPDNSISEAEVGAALVLQRLPGLGAGIYWKLRRGFDSNLAILNAPLACLKPFLTASALQELRNFRIDNNAPLKQQQLQDWEWLQQNDVEVILFCDPRYPRLLQSIDNPPPLLFVRGDIENLGLPQLAVVGSRNPSVTGMENAHNFSRQLAATGFAITSGMALGIDAAAHRGAMAATGKTVAVFGTGIDNIYPNRHRGLAQEIIDSGGTLISEYPIGTNPHASHFPRRNRIISGLSLGVLVVEAAVRSGSLITARYALQQGREVFAIPGSIHNPQSRGCHAVIRDGATLVEEVSDLCEPLQGLLALKREESWRAEECARDDSPVDGDRQTTRGDSQPPLSNHSPKHLPPAHPPPYQLSTDEQQIWQSLGFEAISADAICARSQLDMSVVLGALINLELHGLVEQGAQGYQRIGRFNVST